MAGARRRHADKRPTHRRQGAGGAAIGSTARELQLRTDGRANPSAAQAGEQLSRGNVPGGLGQLSRPVQRQSLYAPWRRSTRPTSRDWRLKWVYPVPNAGGLQGTPHVVEGIMYVTTTNTVIALDAGSGAQLMAVHAARRLRDWRATRALRQQSRRLRRRRPALHADRQRASAGAEPLHRQVLWDTQMADWHQNYNATGSCWLSRIWWWPDGRRGSRACADSWRPTIRLPERGMALLDHSGAGRDRARRRGTAAISITAAAPPG